MADPNGEIQIENNERAGQFEAREGQQEPFISYRRQAESIRFLHTQAQPGLEGQGLAARLTRTALDYARTQGLRVIPICPFVAAYIRTHTAYQDLIKHGACKQ